ncbi:MAG: hypothetical protein ACTSPI_02775 [Candidatus Heimdallarchaeaceae archaeon]
MTSLCPYCNESSRFIANNPEKENPVWFHCEQCERNLKKGKHPNAKSLPADAVIVFDSNTTDPTDYDFEPVEEKEDFGDDLESKLAEALKIAKNEKLAEKREKEEKEVKKPLLEKKREIMRELNDYSDEDEGEEYKEEQYSRPTRRKFKISTEILREVLADYKCNKKFIEDITKKAESSTQPLSTEKLRYFFDRWDAGKKTGKQVQQIIDAYLDELSEFEVDERSTTRRDYPFNKQRGFGQSDSPQVLTIQDFLAMEREKSIREKEELQRQLELEHLAEAKDEAEEYKELYRESVDELKELEKEYQKLVNENLELKMNLKVTEMQMQHAAKYSSDDMKLTADLLDKGFSLVKETRPLAQLGQLTGRRMPSDSRIGQSNISPNQEERDREFEALTEGNVSETSKLLLSQTDEVIDPEMFIVGEDEQ